VHRQVASRQRRGVRKIALEEDEPMSNNFEFGNWSDDIDERYEAIEQAIQNLARKGLIVDTGRRRWCEQTGRYEIVWAASKTLH
jgi:hypothetical protein